MTWPGAWNAIVAGIVLGITFFVAGVMRDQDQSLTKLRNVMDEHEALKEAVVTLQYDGWIVCLNQARVLAELKIDRTTPPCVKPQSGFHTPMLWPPLDPVELGRN